MQDLPQDRRARVCARARPDGFAVDAIPAALLSNILDPNASVLPKDVQYVVVDQNGRTYSGMIASQTATSLTLVRGEGAQDTILRGQVAEMASTGLSLDAGGIGKDRSRSPRWPTSSRFSVLPTVVETAATACAAEDSRPLDIGTLPGLIEPDE